jgi:hypothetical protein
MKKIFVILLIVNSSLSAMAQKDPGNYDESKVPVYSLPDPLVFSNGKKVADKTDWIRRRDEIYKLFSEEVYGTIPEWHGKIEITPVMSKENVFDGLATREELILEIKNGEKQLNVLLLLYLPHSVKPVPLFLGYNFYGNHTVSSEPDIALTSSWTRNNEAFKISDNKVTELSRGKDTTRWPIKEILSRGYGIVTLYYGDIDPDYDDGFKNGAHALFSQERDSTSWGSISAWAWGLSRVMDYLETRSDIDEGKVVILGHSRLGKTALWAGASDKRFAIVISNNSGRAGASLTRRAFGEPLDYINSAVPYWFCDNFRKYTYNDYLLPVDQHELIALIAPRPVYVASAENDLWADPKGEFLSCVGASPVFKFLGTEGFPARMIPPVNNPVIGTIGYHIRTGNHDVTLYDWQCFMNFADFHFNRKK